MEFDISIEKNVTLTFKEAVAIDEVLFEIVNKNPNIMLSCFRSMDNDRKLYFDNIGTKTLLEYINENVFSSVDLQQMLLDMIQTLKILLEHGFTEESILLDPQYVYISIYDKRPKFVCVPCSAQQQGNDAKASKAANTGLAEFFRKIIYSVKTVNSYSLIGVVLEETSKKKFSISHFETQMEHFVDITLKDVEKGYNKALWLGVLLPVMTGIVAVLLFCIGFPIAVTAFIDIELVAYLCVAIAAVLTSVLGFVLARKPKNKKSIERKEIKYNFTNSELESMNEERKAQEIAEQRVREKKVEHLDMNTAIANAVVKSGVITINLPQSADVSAQKRPPVSSDSVSRPANDKGRAYVSPDNGRMNAPVGEMGAAGFSAAANAARNPQPAAIPARNPQPVGNAAVSLNAVRNAAPAGDGTVGANEARNPVPAGNGTVGQNAADASGDAIAYVPRADIRRIDDVERAAAYSNDGDRTSLLNFSDTPLPQKRYTQGTTPYLVSLKSPDKKCLLNKERITVGSSDDCDLIIKVDTVSRHHAVITVSKIGCTIVDNSTNGTYINNMRIQKGVPAAVKNGDVISFNRESFRYIDR